LIVVGAVGFKTLPGLYAAGAGPLSWTNAFFTATSAVCVTGLIVVDTATYFTTRGQAWILLLIQLGGLGMISFTTVIITGLGRRLSLRHESLATAASEVAPHVDYRRLTRDVFLLTFGAEVVGAVLLYAAWVGDFGWGGAVWPAVFHAISAFCNAGFSTFSDSLMGFQQDPLLLGTVMMLVVLGGIGFLVLEELVLWRQSLRRRERFRLSLHSRIALATTAVLIVGGWAAFTFFEWSVTLEGMPLSGKFMNGLFASVTPRTAGFNTIDYAAATDSTNFLTIIFMFIGGSPGSVAGGIKTTTFAVIGLLAYSRMRGRTHTSLWDRTVPAETVQRAVGLFVIASVIVAASIFVFSATETADGAQQRVTSAFLKYTFESFSAFNTVGLSMGVTGELTGPGRWTTVVLMFVGRVGPLTVAAALARRRERRTVGGIRYAYEDVVVG
jgi:trk system potassium uptake protein TrkH